MLTLAIATVIADVFAVGALVPPCVALGATFRATSAFSVTEIEGEEPH
jgi:hypothetical protein